MSSSSTYDNNAGSKNKSESIQSMKVKLCMTSLNIVKL